MTTPPPLTTFTAGVINLAVGPDPQPGYTVKLVDIPAGGTITPSEAVTTPIPSLTGADAVFIGVPTTTTTTTTTTTANPSVAGVKAVIVASPAS